ncbi:MAG TPA: hypothetical protein VK903_02010, partial [Propionicimonas sp.]|nr:hypothetical protein [Propionicimonas sp.]
MTILVRPLSVAACCLALLGGCAAPFPTASPGRPAPSATAAPPSATTPTASEPETVDASPAPPVEQCLDAAAALSLEAWIGQL